MISGSRVKQARELCGYTQAGLAQHINIHQTMITYVESGRSQPSDEVLSRIALATRMPPAFFQQSDPVEFPEGSLLFRARTSLSAEARTQARRYGQIGFELMERLAGKLRTISTRLPQITDEPSDAVSAAQMTRSALGLSPDTPIPHLIRAAERCGVFVIAIPNTHPKLDAFSLWAGNELHRPILVVSNTRSGDRLRFSVAHELGHLIMHQAIHGNWQTLEKEANQFASELLLPQVAMEQEIERPVTLTSLATLKPRWGASLQMLILRAKSIGYISERQYYYLLEQLRDNHWKIDEPIKIAVEHPRAATKMAELLFSNPQMGINYHKLANETKLSSARVREFFQTQTGLTEAESSPQLASDLESSIIKGKIG